MKNFFILSYPKLLLAMGLLVSSVATAKNTLSNNEVDDGLKNEMEVITVSPKGLISYVSASASKSDMPIIETPLSLSVLTEKRITDLGAETIQDAIGYVAGVFNGPYGVDTRGDWAQIRGVAPVQYLDGLQMNFGFYNNVRINPYNLQQIEILKGPSSVLYGQGSTGGIINMVTKRPEAETKGEIWAQVGNFNRKQIAADFTGAINDDESILYRMVGLVRDSETQTDYVDDHSVFLAPSLTWHATNNTSISLLGNFQKNESGSSTQFLPHEGTKLPAKYGKIPSERFVSEPGFDRYDTEQTSVTAMIDHEINDNMSMHWSIRHMDSESTYYTMYAWPFNLQEDKRSLLRSISMSEANAETITSDLQFHSNFTTGSLEHNIVVGADYQKAETDNNRLFLWNGGGLLDIYNPTYGVNSAQLPTSADIPDSPSDTNTQLGFYVQNTVKFNNFIINAALRHDSVETKLGKGDDKDQNATTARLGILYNFDNGIAPYASYSESFLPIYGSNELGNAFKPQTGEQFELGVKFQPNDTEHLITASVFDITDKNRKKSVSPELTLQEGEIEIQGFELEAQLEWEQVDVYASYAYTDSKNVTGEQHLKNAKLSAMPDHMISAWATYRPKNFLPGLKLGLGGRYIGKTSDGSVDVIINNVQQHTALTTDSYTIFDLLIGYEFEQFDLSINVDNITDKTVVTSCLARGDCFYGQRRTVTASVKYRF
jgi:iron complex outermembrane receptor protein